MSLYLGIGAAGQTAPLLAAALPTVPLTDVVGSALHPLPLAKMEAELRSEPPPYQSAYGPDQWRQLSQHLFSLRRADGASEWHQAVGLHRQRLIWSDFTAQHQEATQESHAVQETGSWRESIPEEGGLLEFIRADLAQMSLDAQAVQVMVRKDRALQTNLKNYQQRTQQRFHLAELSLLLSGELTLVDPLPFPLLLWLAKLSARDVRCYIAVSNRQLFSNVEAKWWSTPGYPIYLEQEMDLRIIKGLTAGKNRHGIGSLGWQLWAALKDPDNYQSEKAFAKVAHLSERMVQLLLEHNKKPLAATLHKIIRHLPPQLSEVMKRAYDASYHYQLARQLREDDLFPGQSIFIGRRLEDATKVTRILKRPAHPARFLLGARNLFTGLPGLGVLARELKIPSPILNKMELGSEPVRRQALSWWRELYGRFDLPVELLQIGAAIEYGIDEEDPVWNTQLLSKKRGAPGKLPDRLVLSMQRRGGREERTVNKKKLETVDDLGLNEAGTLYSTLDRPISVERRGENEPVAEFIYRREYVGRLDRESIRDGEFLGEIAIINHVRDVRKAAILEVRLMWPQNVTTARLNLLQQQAAQAAAASPGIQQIILRWHPLDEEGDPREDEERAILYSAPR